MNQQTTIDALWPIARAIGQHLQDWHVPQHSHADAMNFTRPNWDRQGYISAGFAEPGVIEYRLNQHADVRITGIDVTGIRPEDVDVGPIEPNGPQRVVRAGVLANRNATLDDVPWELEYRDLAAQTALDKVAREVGASLSVGLRQQIGYGSEIAQISGETELTVQAEASFRQAWEREMTAHREHEGHVEARDPAARHARRRAGARGNRGAGPSGHQGARRAEVRLPAFTHRETGGLRGRASRTSLRCYRASTRSTRRTPASPGCRSTARTRCRPARLRRSAGRSTPSR